MTQEKLLSIMDQKDHWAWSFFQKPGLTRAQHLVHFRHEYLVYVRDFPILLAQALGQCPPILDVRTALAENLYEEQTGGLSKSAPHPELFLRMMEGMGYARSDFADEDAWLHPAARAYRDFLWQKSATKPWQAAVALLTIWVEGSKNERAELDGTFIRPRGEAAVKSHPLVVHYGCPPEAMQLARAHGDVEGGHRKDAWRMVLGYGEKEAMIAVCEDAMKLWHAYRDGVAERMGLIKGTPEQRLRRAG